FLGASGADRDHQIAVSDLLVSVEGDRIVLRSKRLGQEILPRNTTAHNFMGASLAVYRFLCSIANQGIGDAYWSWGVMADLPFLPRVRRGRFILARARWLLGKRDLAPFESAFEGSKAAKTPDQIRAIRARAAAAMQALRTRLA